MGFLYYTLLTLLIIVSLLLVMLVLIQKGRGGGLSGAFGGGGGSAAFGAKTGDVLTWLTSSFFAVFIILAICLDLVVNNQYNLTKPKTASITVPVVQETPVVNNTSADTTPANPTPAPGPTPQPTSTAAAGATSVPTSAPNLQGSTSRATTIKDAATQATGAVKAATTKP